MANSTGFASLQSKTPKSTDVNSASASIDQIAAVTGKKIRVLGGMIHASGAGALVFNSASTAIGRYTFSADALALPLAYNPDGHFETAVGEKFNIGNAGTLTLTGWLRYVEI